MIPTIETHGYKWDYKSKKKRRYSYAKETRIRMNKMAKIRYRLKVSLLSVEERIELIQKLNQLKIKK